MDLISKVKKGEFPKYHIPNTGKDFTGGREDNAHDDFKMFLGSCVYMLCFWENLARGNDYVG